MELAGTVPAEARDLVPIAVEDAGEGTGRILSDEMKFPTRIAAQIDVSHEHKMLIPIIGLGPNRIELLGSEDQIRIGLPPLPPPYFPEKLESDLLASAVPP